MAMFADQFGFGILFVVASAVPPTVLDSWPICFIRTQIVFMDRSLSSDAFKRVSSYVEELVEYMLANDSISQFRTFRWLAGLADLTALAPAVQTEDEADEGVKMDKAPVIET